ncbi:hypothetical protein [Psychrosphaera haliotis]|uniref:Uncharacterized protein n=1 Tax=Psychrosphaera haliotis TaxID=555083 RepID=A0A6N8FB36_9GAMM|nr:hypothetical protein [Psychrosphaera haliotis]MUH73716.1 hypothetical protein [Psychrosphaera haliotis]
MKQLINSKEYKSVWDEPGVLPLATIVGAAYLFGLGVSIGSALGKFLA